MEQNFHSSPVPVEKRKLNKANIAMAIFSVLALGAAVTFGILWVVEKNKIPETPTSNSSTTVTQKPEENGSESANPAYIYIGQWGIKIKIPENLKNLYYNYRGEGADRFEYSDGTIKIFDHESMVSVSGTDGEGDGITPGFAGYSEHGLGVVSRYKEGAYECQASCPTYVVTIDGYEYYYAHPQAVASKDQADVEWEMSSVKLIQTMLSTPENYSRF